MKQTDDQILEALFRSEAIGDAGFSERTVKRVRTRLWLQRLLVPGALVVGGLLAFKPLVDVLQVFSSLAAYVPAGFAEQSLAALPPLSTALTAVFIIVAAVCFAPVLDD